MTFEQKLAKATDEISREFFVLGGLVGLFLGAAGSLVLQAVLA